MGDPEEKKKIDDETLDHIVGGVMAPYELRVQLNNKLDELPVNASPVSGGDSVLQPGTNFSW